jgi:hypothetical protein
MELETAVAFGKTLGCEWSYTEGANGRKPVLRVRPKKPKKK